MKCETKKNVMAILFVLIFIYISFIFGNYIINNKPINNKRNTILFRH